MENQDAMLRQFKKLDDLQQENISYMLFAMSPLISGIVRAAESTIDYWIF